MRKILKIHANHRKYVRFARILYERYNMPENKNEIKKPKPVISRSDQEMIDELDYEDKKNHKPYDRFERHWDEA